MRASKWGVSFVLVSIILGAFGAHYFSEILNPDRFQSFKTAVNYQMYMGLGLIALNSIESKFTKKSYRSGINLIIIGTVLFSFSILGLVYLGHHSISAGRGVLGPTTPIGGLILISGWAVILFQLLKKKA